MLPGGVVPIQELSLGGQQWATMRAVFQPPASTVSVVEAPRGGELAIDTRAWSAAVIGCGRRGVASGSDLVFPGRFAGIAELVAAKLRRRG